MLYISIFFFCWFKQTMQKRKLEFTPRAAKYSFMYTSMQFLFSFLLPNWHPVFSTSVTLLNNDAKQEHFIYISHINLSA